MPRILAITGGVGGAKLALRLAQMLSPEELTFAVNAGDDFTHLGLEISPDLDTLTYTLADLANPDTGWGRKDESWEFMAHPPYRAAAAGGEPHGGGGCDRPGVRGRISAAAHV